MATVLSQTPTGAYRASLNPPSPPPLGTLHPDTHHEQTLYITNVYSEEEPRRFIIYHYITGHLWLTRSNYYAQTSKFKNMQAKPKEKRNRIYFLPWIDLAEVKLMSNCTGIKNKSWLIKLTSHHRIDKEGILPVATERAWLMWPHRLFRGRECAPLPQRCTHTE